MPRHPRHGARHRTLRRRGAPRVLQLLTVLAVVAGIAIVGDGRSSAQPLPVERQAGADRIATAVAVSRHAWPDGAEAVVLARADTYPDALAAAPLATALDAPLLLTDPGALDRRVAGEIDRLDADLVLLLGGEGAIGRPVAEGLAAQVPAVRRISGRDRFATAAAIAGELAGRNGAATQAFITRATEGKGWPDALTGATLAARRGAPLLLSHFDRLPYPPATFAGVEQVTLVGGRGVLGEVDRVFAGAGAGPRTSRLAGTDRYTTATTVADEVVGDLRSRGDQVAVEVWLATGTAFPDALAAGPAVAGRDAVLLLVPQRWEGSAARRWIAEHRSDISAVKVLGGRGALPDAVLEDVAGIGGGDAGAPPPPDAPVVDAPAPEGWRYELMYATRSDRSDLRPLDGATVRGRIFIVLALCRDDGTGCTADF